MDHPLKIGDRVPAFKVKNQDGNEITEEVLFGIPAVIYFYPKDDTPGCTKEACSFKDNYMNFELTDTLILGVNADSEESHQKFRDKYHLNFPLLSDPNKEMCKSFGVLKNGQIERTTFVINPDGIISWIEKPVNIEGHIHRVLEALKASA